MYWKPLNFQNYWQSLHNLASIRKTSNNSVQVTSAFDDDIQVEEKPTKQHQIKKLCDSLIIVNLEFRIDITSKSHKQS